MKTLVTVLEDGRLEGYLPIGDYSKKHQIPLTTTNLWAKEGRIRGAIRICGHYYIPEESPVPEKRKPGRKKGEW